MTGHMRVALIASVTTIIVVTMLACSRSSHAETCRASWYGFESGNRTANGEAFHPEDMTAAHRTMPFGSRVRVTWRSRSVVVRINDRGPAKWTGRCLDLSKGSAKALGFIRAGVATVRIEVLK